MIEFYIRWILYKGFYKKNHTELQTLQHNRHDYKIIVNNIKTIESFSHENIHIDRSVHKHTIIERFIYFIRMIYLTHEIQKIKSTENCHINIKL